MSQSQSGEREARQDEVVEIDPSWAEEVSHNIEMSRQRKRPTKPSILKVPAILKSSDRHAYAPKLVSIGPYHRGDTSLQAMEEIKWQILDHLLSKAPKNSIHWYLKKMQDLEAKARSYYSEIINMESRRFAEMLLLDGCFIIQLFTPYQNMRKVLSDLLNNNDFLEVYLIADLLLLENQLPYFIINDLLSVLDIPGLESLLIQRAILMRMTQVFVQSELSTKPPDFEVAHILHLLYESITQSSGPQSPPNQQMTMMTDAHIAPFVGTSRPHSGPHSPSPQQSRSRSRCPLGPQFLQRLISRSRCLPSLQCLKRSRSISRCSPNPQDFVGVPSTTELLEAGVKIKVSKAHNFLDISFNKEKGLLEIPAIRVYISTNFIFRNLIALEQCYKDVSMKITYYSLFMDCIINTERDVALLSQKGIIVRGPGNDTDIALLFNQLCKVVVLDGRENYLAQVFEQVNACCNSRWNRWRARLMHDYFSNPWAIISVIAAAVLLVLTIVQTLVSILSYTQQINSSDRPHP